MGVLSVLKFSRESKLVLGHVVRDLKLLAKKRAWKEEVPEILHGWMYGTDQRGTSSLSPIKQWVRSL